MVPRTRSFEESVATLAAAAPPPESGGEPPVLRGAPRGGRLVWPYVAGLLVALAAVVVISPKDAALDHPGLLAMLVGCVVALDLMRIDVFERINLSPASVPALALAFVFGPLGPIAADKSWNPLAAGGTRVWTDDFSNLWSVIVWRR